VLGLRLSCYIVIRRFDFSIPGILYRREANSPQRLKPPESARHLPQRGSAAPFTTHPRQLTPHTQHPRPDSQDPVPETASERRCYTTASCMVVPQNNNRVARFGVFELDLSTGELRKSGVRLRLQGQPIQVLTLLLERAGDVVTREELRPSTRCGRRWGIRRRVPVLWKLLPGADIDS
jgi:hypothetical protein